MDAAHGFVEGVGLGDVGNDGEGERGGGREGGEEVAVGGEACGGGALCCERSHGRSSHI